MNKTTNDNLIKNSAVIAISNKISLLQRKVFNFLIANAYLFLDKKESFEIDIIELKSKLWFNSKNISYLKESLKQLISTVVEFNLLWKDKEAWSATTLLSSVEFREWKCSYSFSPVLRKKLHQPNIYAKIKLSLMKLFSSKYSLCLYEIIIDYHNIWQTPVIMIEDFRKLMWLKETQYIEFKRLSIRVIKPALAEISSIGWYKIEVKYKRVNRKVVALKFLFQEIKKTKEAVLDDKIVWKIELQSKLINDYWLSLRQAQKVIKSYPIEYIKESIEIVKQKISQKVVKNIPAYTITVLKNDYSPLLSTKKQSLLWRTQKSWQKRETAVVWCESEAGRHLLCTQDHHGVSDCQKEAQEYYHSLSKEQQQWLIRTFEEDKVSSDILRTLYKRDTIESPLFRVMFEQYITQNCMG